MYCSWSVLAGLGNDVKQTGAKIGGMLAKWGGLVQAEQESACD